MLRSRPGRTECPQAAQLAALTANLSLMRCRPVDLERCVTPGSLRELASGGCFHLAGRHRLAAPLMLPCPVHIVGVGRAVLSGGAEVLGWSPWGEAEALNNGSDIGIDSCARSRQPRNPCGHWRSRTSIRRGCDVFVLAGSLGHASTSTTAHYVAANPKDSSSLRLG